MDDQKHVGEREEEDVEAKRYRVLLIFLCEDKVEGYNQPDQEDDDHIDEDNGNPDLPLLSDPEDYDKARDDVKDINGHIHAQQDMFDGCFIHLQVVDEGVS